VVVTTAAISRAKLHSSQIVTTNKLTASNFLHAGCPSRHPTNRVKAPKGNIKALKVVCKTGRVIQN